jgi:hypothetical protein
MPYYFMRDTPLQALEQLMMSQPGQKPRGGGIYRSPFRYTPSDGEAGLEIPQWPVGIFNNPEERRCTGKV